MEGLLPFIYRAIVQYRENGGQRENLPLASPGDSQRLSWDSAYIRLPGDSGRISSELMAEALLSPHNISMYLPSHSASNNAFNNHNSNKISASGNTHVRFPPSPAPLAQQLKGM